MRNEYILHNLMELEKHMEKVEAYVYAGLGLVDNYSPTDKEVYRICKIEFELFKQRMQDLKLDIKIDQQNSENKKGDDVLMSIKMTSRDYPYLLTREQASRFLGIDPKSFDKYIRSHNHLDRFMIGRQERYTIKSLIDFIESKSV